MPRSQIRQNKFDSGADYDPASLLETVIEERPKYSKTNWRNADPDSSRGLAWSFAEALPPNKWGSPASLDLAELKHLTRYMDSLLAEHQLAPQHIRDMIRVYGEKTRGQAVVYPVGKFWAMRRALMADSTPQQERDYSGWTRPAADNDAAARYAGWAR